MKKTRRILTAIVAIATTLTMAACGGTTTTTTAATTAKAGETAATTAKAAETTEAAKPEEKIKLKFLSLSSDDNRNNIREKYIMVNVAKELPNLEIEYDLGGGGDDYANKLKAYNASGDMPDVWFSEQNLSSLVVKSGNALDLQPYVTAAGFDKKFKMQEVIAPDKDGKLYCVQPGADQYFTPRLWYHKDIFTKNNIAVPTTFDELVAACKALKGAGVTPMSIVGKGGWTPNLHMLQTMIMAEDPQVAIDLVNNKTDFNNPVVKNAIGRIQTLVQAGAFDEGVTNIDYGPAVEAFTSGNAAMLAMFTWELPNLEKASPDVDFIVWPSAKEGLDANGAIQFWGAPLSGYLASANSKNPEAAAAFAMFCATQDALYYNIENKAPTALDTGVKIEGMSALAQKNYDQFSNAAIKVPSLWSSTFSAASSAEIGTLNSKLLTGQFSPDDFIKAFQPIWAENFN